MSPVASKLGDVPYPVVPPFEPLKGMSLPSQNKFVCSFYEHQNGSFLVGVLLVGMMGFLVVARFLSSLVPHKPIFSLLLALALVIQWNIVLEQPLFGVECVRRLAYRYRYVPPLLL